MILRSFAMNCFAVQLQGLLRLTFQQPPTAIVSPVAGGRRTFPEGRHHSIKGVVLKRKSLGPCAQIAGFKQDGSVIRRHDGILSSCGSKGGIVVTRGDIQKRFTSPQIQSLAKFLVHDLRGRFDHGTAARCPQIPLSGDQGWTARDGDGVRDGVSWAW